jgi:hypothetical protein
VPIKAPLFIGKDKTKNALRFCLVYARAIQAEKEK